MPPAAVLKEGFSVSKPAGSLITLPLSVLNTTKDICDWLEIDGLMKSQLRSRVEFVKALNPQRGRKLLALWEKLI